MLLIAWLRNVHNIKAQLAFFGCSVQVVVPLLAIFVFSKPEESVQDRLAQQQPLEVRPGYTPPVRTPFQDPNMQANPPKSSPPESPLEASPQPDSGMEMPPGRQAPGLLDQDQDLNLRSAKFRLNSAQSQLMGALIAIRDEAWLRRQRPRISELLKEIAKCKQDIESLSDPDRPEADPFDQVLERSRERMQQEWDRVAANPRLKSVLEQMKAEAHRKDH